MHFDWQQVSPFGRLLDQGLVQINNNIVITINNFIYFVFNGLIVVCCSFQVLFDSNGVIKKYENVGEILRDFFDVRLKFYVKRKDYLVGLLEAEAQKLSNQVSSIGY